MIFHIFACSLLIFICMSKLSFVGLFICLWYATAPNLKKEAERLTVQKCHTVLKALFSVLFNIHNSIFVMQKIKSVVHKIKTIVTQSGSDHLFPFPLKMLKLNIALFKHEIGHVLFWICYPNIFLSVRLLWYLSTTSLKTTLTHNSNFKRLFCKFWTLLVYKLKHQQS